jgi:hypothetical protein
MSMILLLGPPPLVLRFVLVVVVHESHVWFEDRWMVASWCEE